jgi:hypothetical protein
MDHEGTDGNYIVAPSAPLIGSLGDTKMCSYNQTNQDCVPTGIYDFRAGDDIEFKFSLSSDQIVRFYYAITSG